MNVFLRSKLVLILTALVMLAGAIAIPLSVNIMHSHAASATTADNGKPPPPTDRKPTSIDDAVHLGKIDEATVRALSASGHADVLVTVRYADVLPSAHGRRGTHADVVALGHAVGPRKANVLAAAGSGVTKLQDYEVLPVMFVRVTSAAALLRLASANDTVSVQLNQQGQHDVAQDLQLIRQPQAAATGATGSGTSVAVLDTGVDYTRPAFGSCTSAGSPGCAVAYAQDFAPDDGSLDDDGHGTNVAGIVLGVAPATKILALDVFHKLADGSNVYDDNDVLSALNWVIANQAAYNIRTANMSLGVWGSRNTTECSGSPYSAPFLIARGVGVLPVVAAGNTAFQNGSYVDGVASPSCASGAVRVGAVYDSNLGQQSWGRDPYTCTDATTAADQIACFSQSGSLLSLLAPGVEITAAGITDTGTSQATPHVAGAAAVLSAAQINASVAKIEWALVNSGPAINDSRNNVTRHRLDLVDALSNVAQSDAMIDDAGCQSNVLARNDDGSTGAVALPFAANFFGTQYGTLYVNNNGNVTFNAPMWTYTPFTINASVPPIIAPFFADVDTRAAGSAQVTYGNTTYGGAPAFCVNWNGVGYYAAHADLLNNFQLLLVSRSDVGAGDFDIIMNYDKLTWETGDASGGQYGFGGTPAGAGYSAGDGNTDHFYQFPGSLTHNGLIDSNATGTALVAGSRGSLQRGRYIFPIRNGLAPGNAAVAGSVTGPNGAPQINAPVQACQTGGSCVTTRTDTAGHYSLSALAAGTYDITAFPPSGSALLPATAHSISLSNGSVASVNLTLQGPTPPPAGTSITQVGTTGDGIPILYWHGPITLTTTACPNGSGSFEIRIDGTVVKSGPMTESPAGSGHYTGTASEFYPNYGSGLVVIHISCPNPGDNQQITFNIYIDPSGVVLDTTGHAITGATVTLYRSDSDSGPFSVVPNGSEIMSPANRANPTTTGTDGSFGWDVIAGFYRVRAAHDGCVSPTDSTQAYVDSPVLTIPPATTGITLTLSCGSTPQPQTISFNSLPDMTYGDQPFTVSATASSGLPVTFTSDTPLVCSVSGSTVTIIATGTCTVRASQSGNGQWAAATDVTQSFAVRPKAATVNVAPAAVQYSDQLPNLNTIGSVSGLLFGDSLAGTLASCTATGLQLNGTQVISPAGTYPLTGCGGLSNRNYTLTYTGNLTVTPEDATVGYTGGLLFPTATATTTTATVTLSAVVSQANDGSAGSLANATVEFDLLKSSNLSNVPDYRFFATANTSGIASATGSLPVDTYTISVKIAPVGAPGLPNGAPVGYYTSPTSDPAILTVYQPLTGVWATGGGWVVDPSTQNKPVSISTANNHGSFGFNVRYRKGTTSPEGQSVYTFRGSDGYDYIIKSNSWVGGAAAFSPTTASFSGKATVIIIDPLTGQQMGGGGNYTYRVDVVDGTPDSYAITVYTPTGSLYHQVGTTAAQIPLGGGNIVLHQ